MFSFFKRKRSKEEIKAAKLVASKIENGTIAESEDEEMDEEEEKKEGALPSATAAKPKSIFVGGDDDEELESSSYKYANAAIADLLAFIGGGDEGKEELRKLHESASMIDKPEEKQSFIESGVRALAAKTDKGLHDGIRSLLGQNGVASMSESQDGFCKDEAFSLMQKLGLNPDKDNFSTSFDAGPPKVFTIVFVNRPHTDIQDKDSARSLLAADYQSCLSEEERKNFADRWDAYAREAATGEPKIPKEVFDKDVAHIKEEREQARIAKIGKAAAAGLAGSSLEGAEMDDCGDEEKRRAPSKDLKPKDPEAVERS